MSLRTRMHSLQRPPRASAGACAMRRPDQASAAAADAGRRTGLRVAAAAHAETLARPPSKEASMQQPCAPP